MAAPDPDKVTVTLSRAWLITDDKTGKHSLKDPGEPLTVTADEAREMIYKGYAVAADQTKKG